MAKLCLCAIIAVLLSVVPRLADHFPRDIHEAVAPIFSDVACLPVSAPDDLGPPPKIAATHAYNLQYFCRNDNQAGRLDVRKYVYNAPNSDLEAVSSQHQFVPINDIQRFGSGVTKFDWGSVNELRFIDYSGRIAVSWHWYVIEEQIYASPARVKIEEIKSALKLRPVSPYIMLVRWFPQGMGFNDEQPIELSDFTKSLLKKIAEIQDAA